MVFLITLILDWRSYKHYFIDLPSLFFLSLLTWTLPSGFQHSLSSLSASLNEIRKCGQYVGNPRISNLGDVKLEIESKSFRNNVSSCLPPELTTSQKLFLCFSLLFYCVLPLMRYLYKYYIVKINIHTHHTIPRLLST